MGARSAQEIWEAALGELQVQVTKPYYRTWLEKTAGLSFQDNQFVVGVPNTFVSEYLDKNQRSLIEKTLIGLTQPNIKVLFQVSPERETSASQIAHPACNSKYTFDSFVVSNSNRLAYAAALSVAENPGHSYNPLFMYGGVGLGKTHLLHAIYHMAQANNIRALYVSAEQFTNEFVDAIREKSTDEFRSKYRSVDMLLIDDIHFISGKEQTEESFFHTFNELHNTNRQIVITSDRPPKSMPHLGDRLCSRFEWGLIADIQPPDFDTRLAILQAKAEQEKANVPLEALEFIAHRIKQNVRELEGSLHRVIAYAKLFRALLTPELAAQALEDIASKGAKSVPVTPKLMIETVANSFQLTPADLKGRKRDQVTAQARQVAMYLIKQTTNCSLAQIGQELGNRNHSTVIHACQKIASDMDDDPYLRRKIFDIQQGTYPKQKSRSY
ncbi:MAG: chromosomal replication initiator protein DnaA [Dehalococcoidales bacterium]|nr:chromosomal replication initiator protein DnaA [Dehalococcoidales bacterium]